MEQIDKSLFIFYIIGIVSVFGVAGVVYTLCSRFRIKLPSWVMYVFIFAFIYVPITLYLKYQSLHLYVDFSHWAQLFHNIAIMGRPLSLNVDFLVPGTINYLSVHFVPLIYIFAIPFKLISRPETLIVFNVTLMLSAVIPLYKLAHRMHGSKRFALLIAALLLWYPTFQYITLYEFEMLRFSIPILLWMLYFFETRRIGWYVLFTIIAILVREEVGLTVAMFGVYAWLFEKRRREGLFAIIAGLLGFILIVKVIMPLFSSAQEFKHIGAYWFSQFGNTPGEIIVGVLRHPLLLAQIILNPIKLANIAMLFIPLLVLPFAAPLVLISIIANIGTGLLSGAPEHTSYMLYYIAPSIPFIFYALLKAWPKITARLQTQALMPAMLMGVLVSNIFFGPSPISLQFWSKNLRPAPFRTQNFHWSVYQVTDHHKKVDDFVGLIPDEAIVSAEQFLAPRLFKKKGTMIFPQLESVDGKYKAEYVFIDKTNPLKTGVATVPGSWDGLRQNPQFYYDWVEKDLEHWQRVKAEDGYFLYKRK